MDTERLLKIQRMAWNLFGVKLLLTNFAELVCLRKMEHCSFELFKVYEILSGEPEKALLGLLDTGKISKSNPFSFDTSDLYNFYGEKLRVGFDLSKCETLEECVLKLNVSGINPETNAFSGKKIVPDVLDWYNQYVRLRMRDMEYLNTWREYEKRNGIEK